MKFEITKKPLDVEISSRIIYIETMILLMMYYTGLGKEKRVSLLKIHLLLWAIQNKTKQKSLLDSLNNQCDTSIGIWSIDIKSNTILTFMIKDKLCGFNGKMYYLAENGLNFMEHIIPLNIFKTEQVFLQSIGKKLKEKNVEKLKNLWS